MTTQRKKLIEVALPIESISEACRRDKDRKVGTLKNVHKWFAPTPTPAWRALLFAALVDDPDDDERRKELINLIRRLVPEDGGPPPDSALDEARRVINESGTLPTVFDPFCGGGSALVEAQRLGLEAVGSDLNPIAVLITRAIAELIPNVAGHPRLHPDKSTIPGLSGGPLDELAADLRYYAHRVRSAVWAQVGHLYPNSGDETVVAWLWARTVTCPNPICSATIPLYTSPWLSRQKGRERWLNPVMTGRRVNFEIGGGETTPPPATKVSNRGAKFRCLACQQTAPDEHVKAQGRAGQLEMQLLAMITHNTTGHSYLPADEGHQRISELTAPEGAPEITLPANSRWFSPPAFGLTTHADLYTNRQLHCLAAFADAVAKVRGWVVEDGGRDAYATAITTILGLCVGKLAQTNSTQSRWYVGKDNGTPRVQAAFGRHALPMVWDFTELNPFSDRLANWNGLVEATIKGLSVLPLHRKPARVTQHDARGAGGLVEQGTALIMTDPPYHDQIGYADLSDYFYVWERRALRDVQPDLFGTIVAPKAHELIATPYRHQDATDPVAAARKYFVDGFTDSFVSLTAAARPDLPMVVIYALRQEEVEQDGLTSTAWDAIIEALLESGLGVVGAWPIHGTGSSRQIGLGTHALASYTAMVLRQREVTEVVDRPGFLRALRAEMPAAIRRMRETGVPPLDLTQAALGPGLAIFSRFARVLEPTGEPMSVRAAITMINQVRGETLSLRQDTFDEETRWAVQWFEEYGFRAGEYGRAEVAFTGTNVALERLRRAGIVASRPPKLWLIPPDGLPALWAPRGGGRDSVWELTMHLARRFKYEGQSAAGELLGAANRYGNEARDLTYRLADLCERHECKDEALMFHDLVVAWPEIARAAASGHHTETRFDYRG